MVCDTVICAGPSSTFPSFDRTCAGDSDCVAVHHTTDCCGNESVMGIAASEQARFDVDEASCEAMYPGCGCAAGPPTADDGTTSLDGTNVTATCDTGTCTSHFVP